MYTHGYSVSEAKDRVLQLRMEAPASVSSDPASVFLPVEVSEGAASAASAANAQPDLLTGISLTLPDGTAVSIRRGSASAVVSFLKLYTKEDLPCSD